ncbi:MAG: GNAT family N-acetyltransferase [Bacteroidetes bacterium]|nr:GNAT family N-acetyltransferase [Bacteroidota bacterium]MDA0902902.1 GNAT family N-acetyltransferase [Bacteroidota bacterium]MDA1241833.1 GNAT family N-acetyltransferase [Bacteroidota bacterium]
MTMDRSGNAWQSSSPHERPTVWVNRIPAEATRLLRHRVLWPHKASPEVCVIDIDHAPHAIHLGAFVPAEVAKPWGIEVPGLDGKLVGACSLFDQHCQRVEVPWKEGMDMRLRVMGTLPEVRGWGAGGALIHRAAEETLALGRQVLWCDARQVAFGFYERLGFDYLNEIYDIPDIGPHRTMALDLSSPPQRNS